MDMVFGIAQIIRVLVQGRLIAEGAPDDIRRHDAVIEAYLGKEVL
jgi:ABC-type branched-subunit amino acid transport system ATPase component